MILEKIQIDEDLVEYLQSKQDVAKFINGLIRVDMVNNSEYESVESEEVELPKVGTPVVPNVKPNPPKDNNTRTFAIIFGVIIFFIFFIAFCAKVSDSARKEAVKTAVIEDSDYVAPSEVYTSVPKAEPIKKINTDSIVNLYRKDFTFKEDEFSANKRIWVEPKNAPKYIDVNSVYMYFQMVNGKASNLRLKIQYTADDWLFIRKYVFNCDGFPIEYIPDDVKRDNKNGYIWEWSDQGMTKFESSLVNTIYTSKSIKVKFDGSQYYKVRTLSQKEISYLQKTIKFYRELGGTLD